ncbi:hypothetical protein AB4Z33_27200 [Paenibacillus sp. 2TAB19]
MKGSTLCGSGGCSAVILKQDNPDGDYVVVSKFTFSRRSSVVVSCPMAGMTSSCQYSGVAAVSLPIMSRSLTETAIQ